MPYFFELAIRVGYKAYIVFGVKSFNKVINSALLFGLPILYKRLFDTVEIDGEETPVSVPNEYNEDAFYFQLIRLMKEMLANEVITKSVVCSLFNERAAALQDGKSDVDSLVKGFYQDTPELSRKRGNTNVKGRGEVVSYGQSTYYSEYKVYTV